MMALLADNWLFLKAKFRHDILCVVVVLPEVEGLEARVGGQAGAELGEALRVLPHAVPLQVELDQAAVDPQEVTELHHAAAHHVVTAQVEGPDGGVPHDALEEDADGVAGEAAVREVEDSDLKVDMVQDKIQSISTRGEAGI